MKLTKSLIGVAAAGALAAGVAYAATAARELSAPLRAADADVQTVTATWAMGNNEYAVGSTTSGDISLQMNIGSSLSYKQVRKMPTADGQTINLSSFVHATAMTANVIDENAYVEFVITPNQNFAPTNISFDIAGWGWGDAQYQLDLNGKTIKKTDGAQNQIKRDGGSGNQYVSTSNRDEFTVSTEINAEATNEPSIFRIYFWSRSKQDANKREFALANVTISGIVNNGGSTSDYVYTIPGDIDLTDANGEKEANKLTIANDGSIGYVENGATLTLKNVNVTKAGTYDAKLWIDYSYGDGTLKIEVADVATGNLEAIYNGTLRANAGGGEVITFPLTGKISEGPKNITYTFNRPSGYVCNVKTPSFEWTGDGEEAPVPDDCYFHIPGTLEFTAINEHLVAGGPTAPRVEDPNSGVKGSYNIGYVKDGSTLSFRNVTVHESGVYAVSMPISGNKSGDMTLKAVNTATDEVEALFSQTIPSSEDIWDFVINGKINEGTINLDYVFTANHTGWVVNFLAPTFTKIADEFACVSDITLDNGLTTETMDGYDWAVNLPMESAGEFTFKPEVTGGTITVKLGDTELNADNGVYTIPVPAANSESIVTINLYKDENAYASQTEYKVRIFHIGGVIMTGIAIDGMQLGDDVVAQLNGESNSASVTDRIFTSLPAVKATFIDGTSLDASAELNGTSAIYTIENGDKTFSLTVDGIHIFTKGENDETASIRYNSVNNQEDGSWFDGTFTIRNSNDGWGGTQFKFKPGTHQFIAPKDYQIKQIVFATLFDNYNDGRVTDVTSDGATVYKPTASDFKQGGANAYDLVVNIENHVPGTPVMFTLEGEQPVAWFDIVYEKVGLSTAPAVVNIESTPTDGKDHAVVKLTFDREMESATATLNGETTIKGKVNGTTIRFALWDLATGDNNLSVCATDTYGNITEENISVDLMVTEGDIITLHPAERFIVVSNVDELRAAVASLSTTNGSADTERTIIFMHNGDYDLGNGVEQVNGKWENIAGNAVALHLNKVYNVCLIGESQEGVLIHGALTGISYPIFSTRYSKNIYMENFTLRNDFDFGQENKGVAVAHYGGQLDIMKNVTLQSNQDTQVTGERGYYLNCTFYGKTDYICGGGDHFYEGCTFVNTVAGVITAPSTSDANEYGYVFNNCTIKGEAGYTLGRPWQNEPRCCWINTTMESLPAENGWSGMSKLPTHFYEFNSMDADGNALDLDKRQNSPSSTNTYVPVLSAEEAAEFTHRNVLGGDDSWLPTEMTDAEALPATTRINTGNDGHVEWDAVEGAVGYMLYFNGAYVSYLPGVTNCYYMPEATETPAARVNALADDSYAVHAVNALGSRGARSENSTLSGIADIEAENGSEVMLFNLQGVRVDSSAKGTLIRVTTAADGTRSASKVYIR